MEWAEQSSAPFLKALTHLALLRNNKHSIPGKRHRDTTCFFPTLKACIVYFFFLELIPFFCLYIHFEQLCKKTCFEYCHYANYSETCSYILDTSFSKLKSYFFLYLCGVFFSLSLWTVSIKSYPKWNIHFFFCMCHNEHPESSDKEIRKVH